MGAPVLHRLACAEHSSTSIFFAAGDYGREDKVPSQRDERAIQESTAGETAGLCTCVRTYPGRIVGREGACIQVTEIEGSIGEYWKICYGRARVTSV